MASLMRKRARRFDIGQLPVVPAKRARCMEQPTNNNNNNNNKKRSFHQMDDEWLQQSLPKRVCLSAVAGNAAALQQYTSFKQSTREVLRRELPLQCKWPATQLNESIQSLYSALHKPENATQPDEHMETSSSSLEITEKPVFTFNDVRRISEVLLKEHEEKLFENFEQTMVNEMARQYDVYVKFTYDQIEQRYHEVPTYMS